MAYSKSPKPCGTKAAYQRHLRHGEEPCEACREANRRYQEARAGSKPRKVTSTYFVPVRCAFCAGDLEAMTQRVLRQELVAALKCKNAKCGREWIARLVVAPRAVDENNEPSRCGTEAGWAKHRRADEPPCEDCRLARNRRTTDDKRAKKKEQVA